MKYEHHTASVGGALVEITYPAQQASIIKAVKRAYQVMEERKWDTIYWAIDLHGVCLKSNYEQGGYQWINEYVVDALQIISSFPETKIILWSSAHEAEYPAIIKFFKDVGIKVAYFNENPEVGNSTHGCFDKKFYFSILLDDKAGFDPDTDWEDLYNYLIGKQ